MSYISPIKIEGIPQTEEGLADKIGKYIAGEVDNLVIESCVKVGCHVDKDELEKALRYDRDQYARGYADGKLDATFPWHRVEEPPKQYGAFAVACVYDGKWYWCKGIYFDGKWLREGDGIEIPADYWMPLPEPPKEDADGK